MWKSLIRKRRKEKGRANAREAMAVLWAELRKIEREGKVPDRVLFVVEDPSLGRALEKKLPDGHGGVVELRDLGPAVQGAAKLAEAAIKGIRPVIVLRSTTWRGWAILVRTLLKNHITIVSPYSFEVTSATSNWTDAPPPFNGWKMLPPNSTWAMRPVGSREAEDLLTEVLDQAWSGEVEPFLT